MAEETKPDLDAEAEPGPRVRRLVRGAERAALATKPAPEIGGWVIPKVLDIDPEGVGLRAGARLARAEFDAPVRDAEVARTELVRLSERARAAIPENPP